MTPKAIRDAANGPWEGDSLPQEDLGPRRDQSPRTPDGVKADGSVCHHITYDMTTRETGDVTLTCMDCGLFIYRHRPPGFCGKCYAGYIYNTRDNFVGRRCECNPRREP